MDKTTQTLSRYATSLRYADLSPRTIQEAKRHLVLYGRAGGAPDPLNVSMLSPKSQKVSAFSLPTLTRGFPDKTRESAERCFALMRDGRLKVHIGKTFPLAQAADAHRYLESRQSTGKLILVP